MAPTDHVLSQMPVNSVQHEGRRCRQRKGCQPCNIFNLLNGCTGLFDSIWPLPWTGSLLVRQRRLQYRMAFQANTWWEESSLQSTMGKPALHRAAWLHWCFTLRLLTWGGSSGPLQMPLLLRLQLDYPTSWWREETMRYQVCCPTAPRHCILPFSLPSPPPLITSVSFRLVRNLAGALPTEPGMFHSLHTTPPAPADSPVP